MTTKPTASTWPERVYGDTADGERVYICEDKAIFDGAPMMTYIRADLVAAREQKLIKQSNDTIVKLAKINNDERIAIIRATLTTCRNVVKAHAIIYDEGLHDYLCSIDPATILNNMEVEK